MAKATRPHFIRCGIEYLGASMVVSSLPAVPSAEVPVPPATAAVSAAAPIASPTIVSRNCGLGSEPVGSRRRSAVADEQGSEVGAGLKTSPIVAKGGKHLSSTKRRGDFGAEPSLITEPWKPPLGIVGDWAIAFDTATMRVASSGVLRVLFLDPR